MGAPERCGPLLPAHAPVSITTSFQRLRAASLRRWVMACVLMAWGCAWAAPLLQPAGLHVVCGANGHVKVVASAPTGSTGASDAHDCPLCTPPSVLPPSVPASPAPSAATECVVAGSGASPASAATGALPPARGPPLH